MEGGGARREAPAWLERLANQYYWHCWCTADHGCKLNPGSFFRCSCEMVKFFCINCQSEPLCRFEVLEHQKRRHRVLHVIRCHWDPAINVEEICELVNIDGITRHRIDGKFVVYLDHCFLSSPNKMERVRCTLCGRILVNKNIDEYETEQELASLKFCSISCKIEGSAAAAVKARFQALIAAVEAGKRKAAVPNRNASGSLIVLPAEGAHERDQRETGEEEPIPPDEGQLRLFLKGSAAAEARAEAAKRTAAVPNGNASGSVVVFPAEGAHERDKREKAEEEQLRLFLGKMKAHVAAEAAKKKAAVPNRNASGSVVVLPAQGAHERDKRETGEEERIPPVEGQAEAKKLLRLFGSDIWC